MLVRQVNQLQKMEKSRQKLVIFLFFNFFADSFFGIIEGSYMCLDIFADSLG